LPLVPLTGWIGAKETLKNIGRVIFPDSTAGITDFYKERIFLAFLPMPNLQSSFSAPF
jgi:hypothetical protein